MSRALSEFELARQHGRLRLKKLDAGRYAVEGSNLRIEKGDAPRYREQQLWYVSRYGPNDGEFGVLLFEAKGKDAARATLEMIVADLVPA